MESTKMVLKNLFRGQHGEADIENRLMDMGRGEGVSKGRGYMYTYG